MSRIDTPACRRYNVAEYFFGDEASQYLDLVEQAVDHVFSNHDDADIREAFKRYLRGDKMSFSSGICEDTTGGFGECDYYGYWEFPLPMNFIDRFYGVKR